MAARPAHGALSLRYFHEELTPKDLTEVSRFLLQRPSLQLRPASPWKQIEHHALGIGMCLQLHYGAGAVLVKSDGKPQKHSRPRHMRVLLHGDHAHDAVHCIG